MSQESLVGLVVFVTVVALDLLALVADSISASQGNPTLSSYLRTPGNGAAILSVLVLQLVGVIGLALHLLT